MTTRFWLRPKWVFGHVLCLFLVVLFVNLGFWQLRRLHEKRERNALIHARLDAPLTSLDDALRAGADGAVYRRVRVRGEWDAGATVLVRNRALDERPGYHVVTPLLLGHGRALVVNRGFTPLGGGGLGAILATVQPKATGTVDVAGILRASEERGSFGPRDPATGHLSILNRVDIRRLQRQSDLALAPVFLQLRSPAPPAGTWPQVLPVPATDEGPHLSYAVQWFIFATVGVVGWPLLLRKTARDRDRDMPTDDEDDGDDDGDGDGGSDGGRRRAGAQERS